MVATQEAQVIPLIETINFTMDSISSLRDVVKLAFLCLLDLGKPTDDDEDLFKSEKKIK